MITLQHEDDPELETTLTAPTEPAWGTWFDGNNADPLTAKHNLLVSCRLAPTEAELARVTFLWAGLPSAAHPFLWKLAGGLVFARPGQRPDPEREENAEVLDLRQLVEDSAEIDRLRALAAPAEGDAKSLAVLLEMWGDHLSAFSREGVTVETIRDWLAKWPRPKQLYCARTPRGIMVYHRPTPTALIGMQGKARAGELYASLKSLLLASGVHPAPAAQVAIFAQAPAMVTSLGTHVSEMAGTGAAVVKKS